MSDGIPAIDQRIVTLRETVPMLLDAYRAACGQAKSDQAWLRVNELCALIIQLGGQIEKPVRPASVSP